MDYDSGDDYGSRLRGFSYDSFSLSPDRIRFANSMLDFQDEGGELENVLEGLHLSGNAPKRKLNDDNVEEKEKDKPGKKVSLCQGSFFTDCQTNLSGNNRLCGSCWSFQISIKRGFVCLVSKSSPFGYRKRTVSLKNGDMLEYRFFAMTRTIFDDLKIQFEGMEKEKISVETCGIVFFKNEEDAKAVKSAFPNFLLSLESALSASKNREFQSLAEEKHILFQKCSYCVRKVFPTSLFDSCTRPSCTKRAPKNCPSALKKEQNIPKVKAEKVRSESEISKSDTQTEILVIKEDSEQLKNKKRKVWEISPSNWRYLSDPKPSKVVIKSPELLSWNSVSLNFAGESLIKNVDYIWGLTEIIILRLPNPDPKLVASGIPLISVPILIRDEDHQTIEGELCFEYLSS
jgi:hypothetical protein